MSFTITNRDAFLVNVNKKLNAVAKKAEQRTTLVMRAAQVHASRISPVYSGDFASNWNVSVGSPDISFSSSGGDYMQLSDKTGCAVPLRNSAAVTQGNFSMTPGFFGTKEAGFQTKPVYLSNAAKHDEPYAWKIEQGAINFRPVNQGKDRVASKTMRHIRTLLGGV